MRRLVLISATLAIATLMISCMSSCSGRRAIERRLEEIRADVARELPPGSSKAQVLAFLTARSIEHSEGKDRIISAGIPKAWESGLTKSGIYLKFYMSEQDTLLRAEIKEVFTAP